MSATNANGTDLNAARSLAEVYRTASHPYRQQVAHDVAALVDPMADEIERLRGEWDRLVKERAALLAVVRAAEAWSKVPVGGDSFPATLALVEALNALPNMQEPCDICASTAGGCPECRNAGLVTRH